MPEISASPAPPAADKWRGLQFARLILALIATPAILIYAWGRVLVLGIFIGRPERLYLVLLIAGIALVMLLTAGLSQRLRSGRIDRVVLVGVPVVWVAMCSLVISRFFGDFVSKALAGSLFILATLWVLWLAWMFYRPWSWRLRIGLLLALVPFAVIFPALLRVDGLTGAPRINFAWRSAPILDPGAALPTAMNAIGPTADLASTTPDDYPQFLGPSRTGVVADTRLSPDWKTSPPREVWRKPVGAGWSSFAIVGDFAVTQEQRGSEECVVCYRLSDGSAIWLHADTARFHSAMGGTGPRATPTIADGVVYSVGGTGILNCLAGETGSLLWSVDILKDNDGGPTAHGVCGSPLVTREWVIVAPTGNEKVSLAAYDRRTGKRVWQGGRHQASYGSPALVELAGSRQVLLVTADGIGGSDFQTGKALWSYTWTSTETHVNCSQPLVVDASAGKVLFCTGYGIGSVLLHIGPVAGGACAVDEVWKSPGKMKTKFTTAVMHEGYVYGLDDGILACLDLATGKQAWKAGRYQHGQILLAGNLLIVQTENGELVLVEPDPKRLTELATIPALSSKTWNNPALAGRTLLVRNDQEAACYELPGE